MPLRLLIKEEEYFLLENKETIFIWTRGGYYYTCSTNSIRTTRNDSQNNRIWCQIRMHLVLRVIIASCILELQTKSCLDSSSSLPWPFVNISLHGWLGYGRSLKCDSPTALSRPGGHDTSRARAWVLFRKPLFQDLSPSFSECFKLMVRLRSIHTYMTCNDLHSFYGLTTNRCSKVPPNSDHNKDTVLIR